MLGGKVAVMALAGVPWGAHRVLGIAELYEGTRSQFTGNKIPQLRKYLKGALGNDLSSNLK